MRFNGSKIEYNDICPSFPNSYELSRVLCKNGVSEKDVYIAGGYIREIEHIQNVINKTTIFVKSSRAKVKFFSTLIDNRDIKDIDVFFKSKKAFYTTVNNLLTLKDEDVIPDTETSLKYCNYFNIKSARLDYISSNCLSFTLYTRTFVNDKGLSNVDFSYTDKQYKIQLINHSYYNDIHQLLNSFDFTVNQMGDTLSNLKRGKVSASISSLGDVKHKKLVLTKNTIFPVSVLWRIQKFKDRGYKMKGTEYFKLVTRLLSKYSDKTTKLRDFIEDFRGIDTVEYEEIFNVLSDTDLAEKELSPESMLEFLDQMEMLDTIKKEL